MTPPNSPSPTLPRTAVGVHLFGRLIGYEFIRFLVAGGVAAFANLMAAWCYRMLLERTPLCLEGSVAWGFAVGTVISFALNRSFTFRVTSGKQWVQAVRFALLSVVGIGLSMIVAHFAIAVLVLVPSLAQRASLADLLAHIFTIGVMIIFNYFGIKYAAFAGSAGATGRAV